MPEDRKYYVRIYCDIPTGTDGWKASFGGGSHTDFMEALRLAVEQTLRYWERVSLLTPETPPAAPGQPDPTQTPHEQPERS